MANLDGDIALQLTRGGQTLNSHTTYAWTGGGLVLTIATVIPDRGVAFELISTYTAAPGTDTVATHLHIGYDHPAQIDSHRAPGEQLHPVDHPRACAYDHAHQLIETLDQPDVSVDLNDGAFRQLEQIE